MRCDMSQNGTHFAFHDARVLPVSLQRDTSVLPKHVFDTEQQRQLLPETPIFESHWVSK